MTSQLEPKRAGQLLDGTFRMLRRHFRLFAGIMAPAVIGTCLLLIFFLPRIIIIPGNDPANPFGKLMGPFLTFEAVITILFVITIGAMFWAVAQLVTESPVTVGECFAVGLRRTPSLLGAGIVSALLMGVAIGILLIPMFLVIFGGRAAGLSPFVIGMVAVLLGLAAFVAFFWVAIGLILAQPAIVVEKAGPLHGLRRSWTLARGGRWHILMMYLLVWVAMTVVEFLVMIPVYAGLVVSLLHHQAPPLWELSIPGVILAAASIAVLPIMFIGVGLIYFNQRVIHEGFDLQVMMQAPPAPDAGLGDIAPAG